MAIQKIPNTLIADNAITATKIANGTLTADDIAANSITAAKLSASTSPTFGGLTVNSSEVLFDNTGGDFTLKLNTNAVGDKNEIIMGDSGTPLAKFGVGGTADDIITGSDGQDFNIGTAGGGRAINFSTDNFASIEMKLDDGNLLVGKTATTLSVAGTYISATGSVGVTRASDDCLTLNRTGNDGAIASFYKDGSPVGSIGVAASDNIYFAGGSGSTKGIYINEAAVYPANTGGAAIDNAVALGQSSIRWTDLYLSGGVQSAGGSTFTNATPMSFNKAGSGTYNKTVLYDSQNDTANNVFSGLTLEMGRLTDSSSATPRTFTITDRGASNRWCFSQYGLSFNPASGVATAAESLDDYEEGTWTPALNAGTFSAVSAQYTKVGRVVTLTVDVTVGTGGGSTISNAPFTAGSTVGTGIYTSGQNFNTGKTAPMIVIGGGSTTMYFRDIGDNVTYQGMALTAGASVAFTFTYIATS